MNFSSACWAAPALVASAMGAGPALGQGDLRALRAEVEALGARVERVEDVLEIQRLQRAYGYYVDMSQFYDVTDLFARDSRLEIGGRGVFLGREHIFAYLEQLGPTLGPVHDSLYNHQQFQPVVDVDPDGLKAHARLTAFIMAGATWGAATYENVYVKEDGVWRIQSLRAPFDMYSDYVSGWAKQATENTRPESWLPPPDLPPTTVYLTYPNFYLAPFHYPNPVTGRPHPAPNPAAGGVGSMAEFASWPYSGDQ